MRSQKHFEKSKVKCEQYMTVLLLNLRYWKKKNKQLENGKTFVFLWTSSLAHSRYNNMKCSFAMETSKGSNLLIFVELFFSPNGILFCLRPTPFCNFSLQCFRVNTIKTLDINFHKITSEMKKIRWYVKINHVQKHKDEK